jgi:hypothetical protein
MTIQDRDDVRDLKNRVGDLDAIWILIIDPAAIADPFWLQGINSFSEHSENTDQSSEALS